VLQENGANKISSHAVLTILNEFANYEVQRNIAKDKRDGKITISFGDSADNKNGAHHNCLLYHPHGSARDLTRVASTIRASPSMRNYAIRGTPTPACSEGVQNCDFQADYMYSVNSCYDLSLRDFAEAFLRHRVFAATIYMLQAPELIASHYSNAFKCFRTIISDDTVIFHMRDQSAPYVHSKKKWLAWIRTAMIDCGNFCITLERVRTRGPLVTICATLIARCIRDYYTTIPLSKWFEGQALVPDVMMWVEKGCCLRQNQLRHYRVPDNVCVALMAYAQRTADDAYKFNEIASYSSGLRRRIVIGAVVYQHSWDCDAEEYYRVVVALFIMGAVRRTDRTKAIAQAFTYLKKNFNSEPILNPIWRWLRMTFTDVHAKKSMDHLPEFKIVTISDEVSSQTYHYTDGDTLACVRDRLIDISHSANKVCSAVPIYAPNYNRITTATHSSAPLPSLKPILEDLEDELPAIKLPTVSTPSVPPVAPPIEDVANDALLTDSYPPGINPFSDDDTECEKSVDPVDPFSLIDSSSSDSSDSDLDNCDDYDSDSSSSSSSSSGPDSDSSKTWHTKRVKKMIDMPENGTADTTSLSSEPSSVSSFEPNFRQLQNLGPSYDPVNKKFLDENEPPVNPPSRREPFRAETTDEDVSNLAEKTMQQKNVEKMTTIANQISLGKTFRQAKHWMKKNTTSTQGLSINSDPPLAGPSETPAPRHEVPPTSIPPAAPATTSKPNNGFYPVTGFRIEPTSTGCTCRFRRQINGAIQFMRDRVCPPNFSGGHCAMTSFAAAMRNAGRSIQPSEVFGRIIDAFNDKHPSLNLFSESDVACYIYHGDANNHVSGEIVELLATLFGVTVELRIAEVVRNLDCPYEPSDAITLEINSGCPLKIVLFHNGLPAAAGHYSAYPRGGAAHAIAKFTKLIDHVRFSGKVLDVSAAPGDFSKLISHRSGINLTSGWYSPGIHMGSEPVRTVPYREIVELCTKIDKDYDYIFNDIASAVASEVAISRANTYLHYHLKVGGCLVSKSFGNGNDILSLYARYFATIEELVLTDASERYFILRGYTGKENVNNSEAFRTAYDRYSRRITTHKLPTPRNLQQFTDEYFSGEMKQHKPKLRAAPTFKPFEVFAITGVASAAKTTCAIKEYPRATFVAPSRTLRDAHLKAGVRSTTPHTLFSMFTDKDPDIVVVDEISQFPVHYIALIHAKFPLCKIVLLGDVLQTPYVNYTSRMRYETVVHYGITNNILTAYKIPQDICNALNSRHHLNMKSESKVERGIYIYKDNIEKFAKTNIPVISFNDATVKHLRDKEINAHTITTYTGSRHHTVVFYIDAASVSSQIINRTEWLYTAMSRATDQLVIAGETDAVCTYYAIHGSPIRQFEEISGAYIQNDVHVPVEQSISMTSLRKLSTISATPETACAILESVILPVNDPQNEFLLTTNPTYPAVESGTLRTPTDAMHVADYTTKVYRISPHKLVKNQISSSTSETIATLIKRYSKKYKIDLTRTSLGRKKCQATLSELKSGLMKALYGRSDCTKKLQADFALSSEQLRDYTLEYYRKLQIKVNTNPSVVKEYSELWTCVDEYLTFFNKRQSKFDPKVGFDTSDKVGQGVASNSKAMNIIFGGYARAMIDKARIIARRNKRNIIFATHDSEAEINDEFIELMSSAPANPKWACNDFSEWDASFRKPFADLTAWLLECMGMSDALVSWFSMFRSKWTMQYHNKYGTTKLSGQEKQFSGNPFTITENTLGNCALCFAIFQYGNYKLALFKGDDSAVCCTSCDITTRGKEILTITGHGLKLHISHIGEFAGWFLTPEGLFPDVVRYSAKFLDKNYRDLKHFNESKTSLQERLSAVKNDTQKEYGLHMVAQYYTENGVPLSHGAVQELYAFIMGSRNIKFAELSVKTISNLVPSPPTKN
jgi:hypothetical protein